MDVGQGVRVQLVQLILIPDPAEQPHSLVGTAALGLRRGFADASGVVVRVGRGSDDHQRMRGLALAVAVDDLQDVVLGFEPGHHEVILVGLEIELGDAVGPHVGHRGAVRDLHGGSLELLPVVVLDADRVRDERVGPTDRETFSHPVVALAHRPPLGPLPLQSVDVGGERDPASPQDEGSNGAFAALNTMAALTPRRAGWITDSAVWQRVSSDRFFTMGRCTSFMPRCSVIVGLPLDRS